jgi:hypothetical protein
MRAWADASEQSPDVVVSLEDAQVNRRNSQESGAAGWSVLVRASNQGEMQSPEGLLELFVVDSDDETLLAQATEPLLALAPGETRDIRVMLPASRRPEPDVVIGAFARIDDLSAANDEDWLMLGDAEVEDPDLEGVTDLDPAPVGPEVAELVGSPKMLIVDDLACVLLIAYTSAGDSTEKLDQMVMEILGGAVQVYFFQPVMPGRWSAVSLPNGLVGAKTFQMFPPGAIDRRIARGRGGTIFASGNYPRSAGRQSADGGVPISHLVSFNRSWRSRLSTNEHSELPCRLPSRRTVLFERAKCA